MLNTEQKDGIKRSICEDCDLQMNWLGGDCQHAEGCHDSLTLLFGVSDGLTDAIVDGMQEGK